MSFNGAPLSHRKLCVVPSPSTTSYRTTRFAGSAGGRASNCSTHSNSALWSPGFAPNTNRMSKSFNSPICGPFDANPSSTTTSPKCGCSRRNSLSRRFAAFLSQSFFFLPSVFTIASGATTGSTSRRCGCTSTAHSD